MTSPDPWSLYWDAPTSQNSFVSNNIADEKDLAEFWNRFADEMASKARVLDIATGNGFVAKTLIEKKPTLRVVGIDKAEINAENYFAPKHSTANTQFHSQIDACNLPDPNESYDGVTSQFGIEYAPGRKAYNEVARVLKLEGKFQFLLHHADSEPVQTIAAKIKEIDSLRASNGILEELAKLTDGSRDLSRIEAAGAEFLKTAEFRTKQISGALFRSIDRILELYSSNSDEADTLAKGMVERLDAQYARFMQMQQAAKNAEQMMEIKTYIESLGMTVLGVDGFYVGASDEKALIGWAVSGFK